MSIQVVTKIPLASINHETSSKELVSVRKLWRENLAEWKKEPLSEDEVEILASRWQWLVEKTRRQEIENILQRVRLPYPLQWEVGPEEGQILNLHEEIARVGAGFANVKLRDAIIGSLLSFPPRPASSFLAGGVREVLEDLQADSLDIAAEIKILVELHRISPPGVVDLKVVYALCQYVLGNKEAALENAKEALVEEPASILGRIVYLIIDKGVEL